MCTGWNIVGTGIEDRLLIYVAAERGKADTFMPVAVNTTTKPEETLQIFKGGWNHVPHISN